MVEEAGGAEGLVTEADWVEGLVRWLSISGTEDDLTAEVFDIPMMLDEVTIFAAVFKNMDAGLLLLWGEAG